jgi:hypothetical protein
MVYPEWPAERTERLCVLWAQGMSSTLIAIEFGMSRSAVLGKVSRMKLPLRRTLKDAHGIEVPALPEPIEEPVPPAHKRGRPPKERAKRTPAQYQAMLAEAVRNTKA